ncbi:hypothetical protein PR048_017898 [Dryococelus australis]|uniref:Carboxylic ester hydrolase n=1 Tax=Dryococelus australis TaxID=614101 RepID=A0ABQ9HAS0_9NEOP|nr:hypothetical protein PR048_017898 [Dryococelus australis]
MSEEVIVDIRQGRLRGKKVVSAAGGEYYSFQGIPYAKPPLGNLRFRPPEKPEPWQGIRDATEERDISPSMHLLLGKYDGNEDCLFVNVYTAQWPARNLKPVMVCFHGGGFMLGSGNTDLHGPDFLVAEDVLLVTLNYRLGALGFLNLEGCDATTNNGLRDQVMALTWVKENIAQFGGDPRNVTIFGVSAGGCSVHHLMFSPSAEGLFHRVIAMSGTALLPLCFIPHDVSNKRGLRLAKVLGCTSDDPRQIVDYLRTVPAEEIVKVQSSAVSDQVIELQLIDSTDYETSVLQPTSSVIGL